MDYLWDEAKRTANLAKHGVDFADAVGVLEDPAALTLEDGDARDEHRYVSLGMGFSGRVLLVFCWWSGRSVCPTASASFPRAAPARQKRPYRGE